MIMFVYWRGLYETDQLQFKIHKVHIFNFYIYINIYVTSTINFEGFNKLKYVLAWLEMVKFIIFSIGLNNKSAITKISICLKITKNVIV